VVLSKLLYGTVRKRSYDWVATPPPCSGERKRKTTTTVTPRRAML
jgi:hypothetical protein